MNIAYIVNQLRKSGPISVLYETIRHLDRARFTPVIIKLMRDDPDRSRTADFQALGVKVVTLGHTFPELELRTRHVANELEKRLQAEKADLVHTHGYHPVLTASLLPASRPRIETLHCVCREDFVNTKGGLLGRYMTFRYLRQLERMEACAAISDTVRQFYGQVLQKPYLTRIHNGIDTEQYRPATPEEKRAYREKLGLPEKAVIFIVTGTLRHGKDPMTAVQAFLRAFGKVPPEKTMLLFLGKGPQLETCRQAAAGCPAIRFNGYTFNVNEYLKAADYSVCPSLSEGFGLNFVESVAAGVPAIGSDIGPFREFAAGRPVLQRLLFQPGHAEELAERLAYAASSSIDLASAAADFRRQFSSERMANEYMRLYEKLLNTPRP